MKKTIAAAACALLMTSGAVSASSITYDIDQAFWGTYPSLTTIGTDVWQAQRQAAVDASPGSFNFVNGWVTVDWDTKSVLDYALAMDITINGVDTVASFSPSDPGGVYLGGHSTIGNSDWVALDMTTSWGPLVERAGTIDELYTATLYVGIFNFLDTGDLTLLMQGVQGAEFIAFPGACYIDFCTPDIGQYDYNLANSNTTTRTYGGGYGIAEPSAVPLPATLWLTLGGLAVLGTAGSRRRKREAGAS